MRIFARLFLFTTALALISLPPACAAPIALVPGSGWQLFGWTGVTEGSVTPISDPVDGYTLTALDMVFLRVVDCCTGGDMFRVTVNGVDLFTTDVPADYSGGIVADPEQAWLDPNFSRLGLLLGPGTYGIQLAVVQASTLGGQLQPDGNGWITADAVPEPPTLALFGPALIFVTALAHRRRLK